MELFIMLIAWFCGGWVCSYVVTETKWKNRSYSDVGKLRSNASRLKRIFQNSKVETAPETVNFVAPHYEIVVGIGPDETASIYISRDALDALARIYI